MSDLTLRQQTLRLASQYPVGSPVRQALLAILASSERSVWVDLGTDSITFWCRYAGQGQTSLLVDRLVSAETAVHRAMEHFSRGLDQAGVSAEQTEILVEPLPGSNVLREFWTRGGFVSRTGPWDVDTQNQLSGYANKYVQGFKMSPWRG